MTGHDIGVKMPTSCFSDKSPWGARGKREERDVSKAEGKATKYIGVRLSLFPVFALCES